MIRVENLTVTGRGGRPVLDSVTLAVAAGETTAILGGSGSGKTTLALAMLGFVCPGLTWAGGTAEVGGVDVLACGPARLRRLRRSTVSYVGQDPGSALTPTMRVRELATELGGSDPDLCRLFEAVGLPTDEGFLSRYPHQVSGGQRRRVALVRHAMCSPEILILDEPTAGLDEATAATVLTELHRIRDASNATVVAITHDVGFARDLAETVVVLDRGRIAERGAAGDTLTAPRSSATAGLLDAVLDGRSSGPEPAHRGPEVVLEARGLRLRHRGSTDPVCTDLSFSLASGEALGILGPSGSGKSTVARALVGLHAPEAGTVLLGGEPLAATVRARTRTQALAVALVPQDPSTALNPAARVTSTIGRVVRRAHPRWNRRLVTERTDFLLDQVGLDRGSCERRPGALSGGQRQRASLARALAGEPEVLICDEVTASLDPVAQRRIVTLLDALRAGTGLSLVVITHDAGVAAALCHRRRHLGPAPSPEGSPVASAENRPDLPPFLVTPR